MNLRNRFAWVRVAGLVSVLGFVACDSSTADAKTDEKKAEPVQAPVEVKAAEVKAEPKVETPPVVVADAAAGDAKAADAAAGDAKVADAAAAGDAKAADAKATDAKATDAKATDTKTADKKPAADKPADKAPAIDGKPLYDSKCKVCHGADGKGTEAMKKNNIPDMADKAWQGKHAKGAVVKAIAEGVDGTKMKAFKDKLKPEEIDAVAAYVKRLK